VSERCSREDLLAIGDRRFREQHHELTTVARHPVARPGALLTMDASD
jgi:hypothetical protein